MDYTNEELAHARDIINQKISDERTKLEAITLLAKDACPQPVCVEGETETGYYCQMMVDPRDIAPILLNHNYPVFKAVQEDFPEAMWAELAQKLGLASVSSVDL